jgi:hypothetical protein
MISLAWTIVILAVVPAAGAQAPPTGSRETLSPGASIPLNPGRLTFQHDGGAAAARNGTITIDLSDLPDGLYEIEVAAYKRTGAESPRARTDPPEFVMARGRSAPLPPAKEMGGRPPLPPTVPSVPTASPATEKKKRGVFGTLWKVLVGE